ncbi:MAG: hypothetical protein U0237_13570 [Thermoleophilia bacterium]
MGTSHPERRTAAWTLGIALCVAAVGAFPLVAVFWGGIAGEDVTFEDSLLGAALVCVPALVAGAALWRWGRRGAGPPRPEGAPGLANAALWLVAAAMLAPWAAALTDRDGAVIAVGVAASVGLAVAAVAAGLVARSRSPLGTAAHRRGTAAAWLGSVGWFLTLVAATVAVYMIMSVLE